jgi:hypothetical protein
MLPHFLKDSYLTTCKLCIKGSTNSQQKGETTPFSYLTRNDHVNGQKDSSEAVKPATVSVADIWKIFVELSFTKNNKKVLQQSKL